MGLDELGHLVAVTLGHADVGEHDIGTIRADPLDRLLAVANRDHLDILTSKRQLDDALDRDAVVGEQEFMRHY